jgi:hypothetical protein
MRSATGGPRGIGTTKKMPRLPAGVKTMSRIRAVTSNKALRIGSSRMNLTNAIVPPTHIATKTSVDSASVPLRSESSSLSKTAARQHHKHVSRTAAATMRQVRDVMGREYTVVRQIYFKALRNESNPTESGIDVALARIFVATEIASSREEEKRREDQRETFDRDVCRILVRHVR